MDTYKITAYNRTTGIVTVDFSVGGENFKGIELSNMPTTDVLSVTTFLSQYAKAYKRGKNIETKKREDITTDVKALLNKVVELN